MLRLRAIEPSDADLFYDVENDETAWDSSDTVAPWSREAIRRFAESYTGTPFTDGQLRLIVEVTGDNTPVALLDFYEIALLHRRGWIGIYVLPEYRNKGLAIKILEIAAEYAVKRLNLRVLGAKILDDNIISLKTFHKAGFSDCGILPQWHYASGEYHNVHLLYLLLR